jgi:hypothetical protein
MVFCNNKRHNFRRRKLHATSRCKILGTKCSWQHHCRLFQNLTTYSFRTGPAISSKLEAITERSLYDPQIIWTFFLNYGAPPLLLFKFTLKLVLVAKMERVPKSTAVSVLPHCSSSSWAASKRAPASPVLNLTTP